jgi:hypothetical protein
VSANLHDASGPMHNGQVNDCNHLSNGRHARDFSLKVPAKPVIKTGAGVEGFAADTKGRPDARTRLKSEKWSSYKSTT